MKTIKLSRVFHREEDRISLSFDFDKKLTAMVRGLPGRKWSRTLTCWHIPYVDNFRQVLALQLPGINLQEIGLPKPAAVHTKTISVTVDQRVAILYVKIPYALKDPFKKLEGAWYHPGAKTWSAVDTGDNRQQLQELLATHDYEIVYANKEQEQTRKPVRGSKKFEKTEPDPRFERMMRLEGKSENTIRQYKSYVCWFLATNKNMDIQANPRELVREFLYRQVIGQAYGPSQQNGAISAIKQFYFSVYNIELDVVDIPRPKPKRKLPKVISEAEFKLMANATKNPKHKLILMLLYGCGLRRKELCELKVGDIDFERELILVKGKGDKFRVINPGNKLLAVLKKYIKSHLPGTYLIEGADKNAYSGSSVAMIVRRAAENAKVKRHVHPHMLRHSFATHHMERGIELRLIQETLGHASSRTTEIYTHVSRKSIKKMPNLLDELNF